MTFFVEKITKDGASYTFTETQSRSSQFSLLVGVNGSGKSTMLADLIQTYLPGINLSKQRIFPSEMSDIRPSRVISQTYSPFSRFPSSKPQVPRAQYPFLFFLQDRSFHVPIGWTQDGKIERSPSKAIVARILQTLHRNPEKVRALRHSLKVLGFESKISLRFGLKRKSLLERLKSEKDDLLARLSNESDEFRKIEELKIAVAAAFFWLEELHSEYEQKRNRKSPRFPFEFDLEIQLTQRDVKKQYETIKMVAILDAANLVSVRRCRLAANGQNLDISGEEGLDLNEGSSGQQQIICSLIGLALEIEDDSLVAIDEPELSLHPAWQMQFLDLMEDVFLAVKGCHVLIATHSALVAQRAKEKNIQIVSLGKKSPQKFHRDSNAISVDQTLLDIFHVPVRDSLYVARLILSLLMAGERTLGESRQSKIALRQLEDIYSNTVIKDEHLLLLIKKALRALDKKEGGEE